MIYCGLNSDIPRENLAIDEAILTAAFELSKAADRCVDIKRPSDHHTAPEPSSDTLKVEPLECLRLWEMSKTCVVLGRGSKLEEVNEEACRRDNVELLRRCSGGSTIVAGPGCLMFSLILSLEKHPYLRAIDAAHRWIMSRIAESVSKATFRQIAIQGSCDLTIDNKKISGNAVRYNRDFILYHGTLLYRFPLEDIAEYLLMPIRQPDYRAQRSHSEFITNIECDAGPLRAALIGTWNATDRWETSILATETANQTEHLLQTKYR